METSAINASDLRAKFNKKLGLLTNIEYKNSAGETKQFVPRKHETIEIIEAMNKYITADNPEITAEEFAKIKNELKENTSIFSNINNKNKYIDMISKLFENDSSDGGKNISVKEIPLIFELMETWNM